MDYLQYTKYCCGIKSCRICFKPYYKWITFNTWDKEVKENQGYIVLNLIINGLPSIRKEPKLLFL